MVHDMTVRKDVIFLALFFTGTTKLLVFPSGSVMSLFQEAEIGTLENKFWERDLKGVYENFPSNATYLKNYLFKGGKCS